VEHRPGDRARDRRRLHARARIVGSAHQHAVHALHHAPEGAVLLQEAQHDRIALHDARHVPALDREIDHARDQHLARSRAGALGLRGGHGRLQSREHDLRDREDDLVLGVVLVVDGGLRHADRVGDHLERGAADAVLGEEVERRFDDARLCGRVGRVVERARARGPGRAHGPRLAERLAPPSRSASMPTAGGRA
jgi:hypothetical protein